MENRIDLDRVYNYCKDLQSAQKLTNAEIAERANIAKSTIDNYFYGTTRNPGFSTMCAIIDALGGSVDAALGWAQEANTDDVRADDVQPAIPQQPIHLDLDISNAELDKSHAQTIDAKDKHIDALTEANNRLRRNNHILTCALVLENLAFAIILILDALNSAWGYFRFERGAGVWGIGKG